MSRPLSETMKHTRHAMTKVPEITIFFWIIKVLTTGMGEVTSDFLAYNMNPVIAVAIGFTGLILALIVQFSVRKYVAWIYWLTVVMVSIFGTMAADVLHVGLGIPYVVSTTFYIIVLTIIFIVWYVSERTLAIHSIYTPRREFFYWATILATFALGTATGDLTATTLHLGYFTSGVMFAVIIAIPAVAYFMFGLNEIFAFWAAYIITRPLGASFADWLSVSHARGGLGFGTGKISLTLTAVILVLVGYMAITRKDIKEKEVAA